MRKFLISFSLTVITVLSIYVCYKILGLPTNYTGTSNTVMKSIIESKGGTDTVVLDLRAADIVAQIFVILSAVITISMVLCKLKKVEGEKIK